MKKILFVLLAFSVSLSAQESVLDSLDVQNLEEVIVSSVRVKDNIPIAFNNVSKEEISKRNLGQDIPILLNFLPNVVTTSDAGAGFGYTGIRIRGVNSQSTNVTINGIPYNDAESLGTFWVDLPDLSSSIENLQSILSEGILSHDLSMEKNPKRVADAGIVEYRKTKTLSSGYPLTHYANFYFRARNAMLWKRLFVCRYCDKKFE